MSERSLACHPSTPSKFARTLSADARIRDSRLELRYRLEGEIVRLRVPPLDTPARTDKLWLHTCFEVFIKRPGEENYYEFNFSPSTRWAMYRFDCYREGMSPENFDQPPRIAVSQSERVLTLECSAGLTQCRDLARAEEYQLAVCAVIEDHDEYLSYWALAHPPGKPDFHHRDGFVLRLEESVE